MRFVRLSAARIDISLNARYCLYCQKRFECFVFLWVLYINNTFFQNVETFSVIYIVEIIFSSHRAVITSVNLFSNVDGVTTVAIFNIIVSFAFWRYTKESSVSHRNLVDGCVTWKNNFKSKCLVNLEKLTDRHIQGNM